MESNLMQSRGRRPQLGSCALRERWRFPAGGTDVARDALNRCAKALAYQVDGW